MSAVSVSPSAIPQPLLARYQRSGPRYTSYPTAPHFKIDPDIGLIQERWRQSNGDARGIGFYLHLPFCPTRCLYCGCHTFVGPEESLVEAYLDALGEEIRFHLSLISAQRPVGQIALGGGTPTFLKPEQMKKLMTALRSCYPADSGAERSIEIDPRRVENDYLDALLQLGFNRFSFGVQDLDPAVQGRIERVLPEERLAGLLGHLRRAGMEAINLDLIYGLPGQTLESFSRTISRVAALRPSRIALFGYAHVPWVSPHQKRLEPFAMPDAGERMALFGMAYDLLLQAGYAHIGMDHFALPGDELLLARQSRTLTRNFMGYSTRRGLDLVGLGASSISAVNGTYTQNEKEIGPYVRRAAQGAWAKGLVMTGEDLLRRELILDLFCNYHVSMSDLEKRFPIRFPVHFAPELEALAPMADDGLLEIGSDSLSVTPLGRFFIRNICMCFDRYMQPGPEENRYSKTI